mmetsp:Transcript_49600/g.126040  ORF Transcript_49600/g.126040 Transcript_49600/m.126040 type:complete len:313 (-) Transcript_49600:15-953(-)
MLVRHQQSLAAVARFQRTSARRPLGIAESRQQMAFRTFIARAADGFMLVEAHGEASGVGTVSAEKARGQAQQLLTCLHSMPTSCSVECAGGFVGHLRISEGVCFLGLFCPNYPRNAAFAYLEDVRLLFQEELKREFGTGSVDYRSCLECIDKPYYFGRFDRHIAKILIQYRDPSSSTVLVKLQSNLAQVSHIMKCNINELMLRGEALDSVSQKASNLKAESKKFSGAAHALSLQVLLQKYLIPLLTIAVVAMLAWFIFVQGDAWNPVIYIAMACLCLYVAVYAMKVRAGARQVKADKFAFASEYHSEHAHSC